ncbi:hypothetical protein BCR42DRAFT_400433 [Absidia repens]|uniref:LAG1-DNAbind-domain-containing protein n=1 Tax=Absidia repens TaxID=90262 RepID=A0A1X2J1C1_9FUNG|nr:hypothetical protein BCR42DRAFT_400433 [Absidia repens]
MWMMDTKRQSISKIRATTKPNKSPPPSSPATTMSTSSPSPPITPSQQLNGFESFHHHTHPSIPEEDDDMNLPHTSVMTTTQTRPATSRTPSGATDEAMERRVSAERRAKNSLVSARIIQGENTATQLKPLIQQYLLSNNPSACGEHSVTLLTSKVAQKSYGTEKRFLCPPPTTVLSGASWWTTNVDGQHDNATTAFYPSSSGALCTPKLTIHISGEATSQNGALEWCNANGSVIDNTSSLAATAHASHLGETAMSGKCVSKQLHINDADEKRRRVEVLAKIQLGNNIQLGTLASKGIKVISKPSKKRQSVKNMELCIHHGTTVSLFNRIRSQTVSTKYLGVSNSNAASGNNNNNAGTCFVARTGSWDPFVIWIVDMSRSPESASSTPPQMAHHPLNPDFPPPPAIALQSGISHQAPIALHYNQPVVLQCVSTGLVSPVMVIRKVDKGSAVLGGNRVEDLTGLTGGECGDEAIGDPVSQLHKIAFQIVQDPSVAYHNKASYQPHPYSAMTSSDWILPQATHPVTYLACLNDVVGMHKTTTMRTFVSTRPPTSPVSAPLPPWNTDISTYSNDLGDMMVSSQIEAAGKVVRKRRVSCDVIKSGGGSHMMNNNKFSMNNSNFGKAAAATANSNQRRRVNSLNDVPTRTTANMEGGNGGGGRRGSLADRRQSISSDNGNPVDGNCWTEDVSDAAVWTIVGTDSAKYTFWTPPSSTSIQQQQDDDTTLHFNNPFTRPQQSHPITPFPLVNHINSSSSTGTVLITGENLSRDLSVWFGDVRAPLTEYKSRDLLSCTVPDVSLLAASVVVKTDVEHPNLRKLPLLLVRGDGVVYRTGEMYTF